MGPTKIHLLWTIGFIFLYELLQSKRTLSSLVKVEHISPENCNIWSQLPCFLKQWPLSACEKYYLFSAILLLSSLREHSFSMSFKVSLRCSHMQPFRNIDHSFILFDFLPSPTFFTSNTFYSWLCNFAFFSIIHKDQFVGGLLTFKKNPTWEAKTMGVLHNILKIKIYWSVSKPTGNTKYDIQLTEIVVHFLSQFKLNSIKICGFYLTTPTPTWTIGCLPHQLPRTIRPTNG